MLLRGGQSLRRRLRLQLARQFHVMSTHRNDGRVSSVGSCLYEHESEATVFVHTQTHRHTLEPLPSRSTRLTVDTQTHCHTLEPLQSRSTRLTVDTQTHCHTLEPLQSRSTRPTVHTQTHRHTLEQLQSHSTRLTVDTQTHCHTLEPLQSRSTRPTVVGQPQWNWPRGVRNTRGVWPRVSG